MLGLECLLEIALNKPEVCEREERLHWLAVGEIDMDKSPSMFLRKARSF